MRKSVIIFIASVILSAGVIICGSVFVNGRTCEAILTEETLAGDRTAAEGLTAGFQAGSGNRLYWNSSYDYSTGKTESGLKREEREITEEGSLYDDIRFTGRSSVPYTARIAYDRLEGLQNKKIHRFYDEIQQRVSESGSFETGKIKLKDYLDFYPVNFRFQFGSKIYNMDNALKGLKTYEMQGGISGESGTAYDGETDLYTAFNRMFRIPVIDNEYQEYKVSKGKKSGSESFPVCETEIEKPLGEGEDYYEFDPVIAIQEENIADGKKWVHPDLSGGLSYEVGGEIEAEEGRKSAAAYNLKNRMLFIVNNKTAKGVSVDVSKIRGGYGIYELPIEVRATATIKVGKRSRTVPDPKPLADELKMVYPLDEEAEYIEIALSDNHRYAAVFSVKNGICFVDLIDADTWESEGAAWVFPASEKLSYVWGEDGTLAVTNHKGHIAVFTETENEKKPYELLYRGKLADGLDAVLFDTEAAVRAHSYARYRCGADIGLAVASKDGKTALVQNPPAENGKIGGRISGLECVVIDKSGVIYRGRLKSSIAEPGKVRDLSEYDGRRQGKKSTEELAVKPVREENWVKWKDTEGNRKD